MLDMSVDPVKLASGLGIRVFNAKFGIEGIHGLSAKRSGATQIYVERDDAPVRKRFTIAHELGHVLLHLPDAEGEFVDDVDNFRTVADPDAPWDEGRRREWEANVFASALLMEAGLVRKIWPEVQAVDGMARWFQVSEQAMAIRLAELGLSQ